MNEIIRDLETVVEVFESYGVKPIVVYGALLGHYRDGKFLPGDDDIDLAVMDKISHETRKKIGWDLLELGFVPQPMAFNVYGRMETQEPGYNGDGETGIIVCQRSFKFTIFFFKMEECDQHGYEYVCTPRLGAKKLIATPARYYSEFDSIKIGKREYLTPRPIEEYLAFTYFNNWKDKTDRRHGDTYDKMHGK